MHIPLIWASATEAVSSGITLSTVLDVAWCVLLVLFGVNMLIIVHEFGHFIVARMCGVRCDKFYIWFDIYGWRFFRFKWGDTEYGLGVLPLGGYVKMFGQEDNPGAIRAEIERTKAAKESQNNAVSQGNAATSLQAASLSEAANNAANVAATETTDANTKGSDQSEPPISPYSVEQLEGMLYAKDSYLSKSVPQRMAIIVAGVVMNVIFAFICGIGAFSFGHDLVPATIGFVAPGSPAWFAEIQPGDKVLSIAGNPVRHFGEITSSIISSLSDKIELQIERPGVAEPIALSIAPKMKKNALVAQIGVGPMGSLKLNKMVPVSDLRFPLKDNKQLRGGETLVAINGEKVATYDELQNIERRLCAQPLKYTFERNDDAEKTSTVELEVPAIAERTLGFAFEMGAITAVRPEAEKTGFAVGDVIQTVDGEPVDPLRLSGDLIGMAESGKTQLTVVVKRGNESKTIEMPIAIDSQDKSADNNSDVLGSNILGVAYDVVSNVGDYQANSLPVGGTVVGLIIPNDVPKEILAECGNFGHASKKGFCLVNKERAVPFAIVVDDIVRLLPVGTAVTLQVKKDGKTVNYPITVANNPKRFETDRGLNFTPEMFRFKAETFGEAVQMGTRETVKSLLAVYYFIKNMTYGQATGTSRISVKTMGGPISIVKYAYYAASSGLGTFFLLLCLLGANLAVLNILPIPVLDGGHLVFLTYEAIFRKPPNETVQIILSYVGLFLLLALMVWAFSLDLGFVKR